MHDLLKRFERRPLAFWLIGVVVAAGAWPTMAPAALTSISSEPVITRQQVSAKPNLMFVLDESGSMARAYMPDEMSNTSSYGYLSAQCNGVAFDPALPYKPPVDAAGNSYPNQSFTAAKDNGYSGTATTNLTNQSYYVYNTNGSQKRMGWTYDSSGNVNTGSDFYKECNSNVGSAPGFGKFDKVTVTAASPEAQKYANWYSYYRTRSLLMRTAVGLAVAALSDGYRVGFSRINSTAITDGIDFRDTKPFDSAQKTNFYSSLYSAEPGGGTPLRGALSKIGRYYASKATGQTYDPMEYACQRNYALLSTDGYWNSGGSPGVSESSSYGPYDLSGSAVGNQDATEVRPMYDGGTSVKTIKTPTTTETRRQVVTTQTNTVTSRRNFYETNTSGCFFTRNEWTTPETRVETTTTRTTSIIRETSTVTQTVVITNGTVTSDTTSAPVVTTSTESTGTPVVVGTNDTGWVKGTRQKTKTCSFSVNTAGYGPTTSTTSNGSPSQNSTILSVEGPTEGADDVKTTTSGGSSDTLSDVAEYYFVTDLRSPALSNCTSGSTGADVCSNSVPTAGRDNLKTQHMVTFTLGLGTSGTLAFDKDYLKQTSGDYVALTNGTKNWPPTTTNLSGNSGDARNIDDLWHAAVNGRGQYYSALDATGLSDAIAGVINSIKEAEGAGAAASFNTLAFVAGLDNQVYQAGYTTNAWTGEITAYAVDGTTGEPAASPIWSAQAQLNAQLWSNRKIYYRQSAASATMRPFNYANLNADGLGTYFAGFCSKTPTPGQCSGLSATNKTAADNGTNLVDYLSGDRSKYQNAATPLFRTRNHILGDIINGAPVYVGKPPFNYTDAGYASFVSTNATRQPMVYAGANDGMLHAFSATTGVELWAYVPTTVMPKMFRLADAGYATSHESFVDAEPVIGDIYHGGAWKTILVGGLGLGGKGYYALDVTDPLNPKSLWEINSSTTGFSNLGLTYGNPVITKRADGTWVVAFTSGYNNADGKGHLYIVNAGTGAQLLDIATTAGSSGSPSGLAKINAWIDVSTNNTALRFYGGDMLGNLWRFDIDNKVLPYQSAMLLAQLQTAGGAAQPVTIKPETMLVSKLYPIVVIGTGRYLGDPDITNVDQQSIYILKDPMTATGLGVVRTNLSVVKHTLTVSGTTASSTTEPINWDVNNGWWFDLPNTGERIINSMSLLSGTLFIPSAIPSGSVCISGGSSWLYRVNVTSGLSADPIGSQYSNSALIVGLTGAKLSDGTSMMYVRDSNRVLKKFKTGDGTSAVPNPPRRSSWRELIN